eukprot:2343408-Amphidinium_carterae.1
MHLADLDGMTYGQPTLPSLSAEWLHQQLMRRCAFCNLTGKFDIVDDKYDFDNSYRMLRLCKVAQFEG